MAEPTSAIPDWPVHCVRHRDLPAIALCTRCGRFLCRQCRNLDEQGLSVCPQCDVRAAGDRTDVFEHSSQGFAEHLITTSRMALFHPARFIREIGPKGELAPAVKFGLLAIIFGKLVFLLWILLLQHDTYLEAIQPMADDLGLSVRTYQILQVALLPLDALARIALFGLLFRLGVRLAMGPSEHSYRDFIRLFSYASAGYLWLIIPLFFGMAISLAFILIFCFRVVRVHFGLVGHQSVIAMVPLGLGLLLLDFFGGF